MSDRRLLLRDVAIADGRLPRLQVHQSVLLDDGHIAWIRPDDDADPSGAEVLDGGGATLVPAFVDSHSHLTGQGGSHWIARFSDGDEVLSRVARDNARRLVQAGILWARDVGSPPGRTGRAVGLDVRDELGDEPGMPHIRAAGTWLAKTGYIPIAIQVEDGEQLLRAALHQLDAGADFVKIMLDPPAGSSTAPFSVAEVRRVREAVHARGARITAHAGIADGIRVAALAAVDSIEHGFELDDATAALMKQNDVALVSTLSVLASWETFAHTTTLPRFASPEGMRIVAQRREAAVAAIGAAKRAGVRIAAGSDFGGGSVRAGHLAWEIELLVTAGLEPWEALAAATWRGGELLGDPFAGQLAVGCPADLVLVHGDPLSDPAACWRVWAVFRHGRRVA